MKERLKDLVHTSSNTTEARNRIREYLHAEILGSLQRSGTMVPLAFQGGTALRFLYSIRRFSEDLDFALERPFPKGRDIYDLIWYLSDPGWPSPNLTLLNNALAQTGWTRGILTADDWRGAVSDRLKELDWTRIVADVRPFLESPSDVSLLSQENLDLLLKQ